MNIKVAMIFSRRLNFLSVSLCMIEARRISLKMNFLGSNKIKIYLDQS